MKNQSKSSSRATDGAARPEDAAPNTPRDAGALPAVIPDADGVYSSSESDESFIPLKSEPIKLPNGKTSSLITS